MCVIAYSPRGVDTPTKNQVEQMFNTNPDGASITLVVDGKTIYYKGLMTLDDFNHKLSELDKIYKLKNLDVVYHFRIGTSGKNDEFTTHPYIVSNNIEDMRRLDYYGSDPILIHNGVLTGLGGIIDKNSNDTQDFAKLVTLPALEQGLSNDELKRYLGALSSGSRLLLIKDGGIITTGTWHDLGGIKFSNMNWSYSGWLNYLPSQAKTTNSTNLTTFNSTAINAVPDANKYEYISYSSKKTMYNKIKSSKYTLVKNKNNDITLNHNGAIVYYVDDSTLEVYTIDGMEYSLGGF